jgi:hypothetical protein
VNLLLKGWGDRATNLRGLRRTLQEVRRWRECA